MRHVFLEAKTPLTKTISRGENGALEKTSYPHVLYFTSHDVECASLDAFQLQLQKFAAKGACLLKGTTSRVLVDEKRAGATDPTEPTSWVCLDVDGADFKTPEEFLKAIGLEKLDCVVQYSASHGFDDSLRAHIFALLAKPTTPAHLKSWLKHLNLETPLSSSIKLSRTGVALRWPLDITTCQNDKLLYIAPPILKGLGHHKLKDPVKQRIVRINGSLKKIVLPDIQVGSVDEKARKVLNALRKAAGMRAYNKETVLHKGTEIAPSPGRANITGIKQARGFTYLNLNGGDSWGYYHPDDDFDVIHNFKGEPGYLTKDLLPDYYAKNVASTADKVDFDDKPGRKALAFLDVRSDQYYRGVWDQAKNTLELNPTSSLKKLNDFMTNVGEIPHENVPEWDYVFDPTAPLVDTVKKTVNRYHGSPFSSIKAAAPCPPCPSPMLFLLKHVFAGNDEAVERFLNWLAVVWQHRIMTGTIWVLQGTYGTGKGLVVDHLIRPVFGRQYVRNVSLLSLARSFNGYLEDSLFVFFDESKMEDSAEYKRAMEVLKSISVSPQIEIERKYSNSYLATNFTNFILASNYHDSVYVPIGDRRFNIGPYQTVPLNKVCDTKELVAQLKASLEAFALYLISRPADVELARLALMNTAKEKAIDVSVTGPEEIAMAILKGDLDRLVQHMPSEDVPTMGENLMLVQQARKLIEEAVQCVTEKREHKITRDSLQVLFLATCIDDSKFKSPTKFSKWLGHMNIEIKPIHYKGRTVRGLEIEWKASQELIEYYTPKPAQPKLRSVK